MKRENCYEELSIKILSLMQMDVCTVSGDDVMNPEGDYDDDDGWNE